MVFAGPLAECDWDKLAEGNGSLSPADDVVAFLKQPEVQQIERVAEALQAAAVISTADELKTVAAYSSSRRFS